MAAFDYTPLVIDHFQNPRNMGKMEDADGIGVVGNPVCGDMTEIRIKVRDDRITDIKFQTFGCGAAIASASMATEIARGKPLQEAEQLTNEAVAEALGGLPAPKLHCSNLAADALRAAIRDYRARDNGHEE